VVEKAAPVQQLPVGALLHDLAVPDDDDVVGVADGAQPVGDDEEGVSKA
jgi:hypothetical protein